MTQFSELLYVAMLFDGCHLGLTRCDDLVLSLVVDIYVVKT